MRSLHIIISLLTFVIAMATSGQEISTDVSVRECHAGGDTNQTYFLIHHKSTVTNAGDKMGLLLILPGGPGTRDFLPFCANVLTSAGVPKDFLAAELIAPQWCTNEDRIVWPSKIFGDPSAKFTTEEFIHAVIADVAKSNAIDPRYVFTLGWSSSGHALYSASLSEPQIHGSIIAMSRFIPSRMPDLKAARGKNYFLYHSPDDQICPFADAELAKKTLTAQGANVKLVTYKGGHGWVPYTYYCDHIREGILWLKERANAADSTKK